MRLALDIQAGAVVANSVAALIERFEHQEDKRHFLDQAEESVSNRKAIYRNLTKFFGRMAPGALRGVHGYQFLDARAEAGAPARANKELAMMQTILHYAVRWGLVEANPFVSLKLNRTERKVRTVSRRQVVRFYLWSVRQGLRERVFGCAAMFAYLTGFRASEVRPFLKSGVLESGVQIVAAKRKLGEDVVVKHRRCSRRLAVVIARSMDRPDVEGSPYLFAPTKKVKKRLSYTKSGWNSSWQDVMRSWILSFDPTLDAARSITTHASYFALQDIRPVAISKKFERRDTDVYDFAAHANPQTTHRSYDRRRIKNADATE